VLLGAVILNEIKHIKITQEEAKSDIKEIKRILKVVFEGKE
jgi:hypothetical protein